MTTWTSACDGWIIEDGTYDNIEVGQVLEASIEFWYLGQLEVVGQRATSIQPNGDCKYKIEASIVELSEFAILDLGQLLVSCHAAPMTQFDDLRQGDFIKGTIGLGLNPFDRMPDAFPRRKRWIALAF